VLGGVSYNCFYLPRAHPLTHKVISMDSQKARIRVRVLAACFTAVALTAPAFAETPTAATSASAALSHIRIGNFGKVNDTYFRGSQPKGSDFRDLAAIGVKTVIDLQVDGPSNEAGNVTAAGMKFFRIGMTTTKAPTDAQITQFFEIVNNPANQPVYVHCAGGRHRTGTMTALYRMTFNGWTPAQAYSEMKQYRFEGFPDHPVLRNYVYAYHPAAPKEPTVLATTIVGTK
jgi:tyrosine-protein phosphatase SIW14